MTVTRRLVAQMVSRFAAKTANIAVHSGQFGGFCVKLSSNALQIGPGRLAGAPGDRREKQGLIRSWR
jgi:hypothetical protein